MKMICLLVLAAALGGCTTSANLQGFFGTNDPCLIGSALHAGYVTTASRNAQVAQYARIERSAYAGFMAQCQDNSATTVTLKKALDAYTAAVDEYRKG
jgi:hypothetical protein